MDNNIQKRVGEIYGEIKALKDELEKLREQCPHDSYIIGNYSHYHPSFMMGKICSSCGEYLGEPSHGEIEKFENETQK